MSGETQRNDARRDDADTTADMKAKAREAEARVGKYGGDDGALEHENTEIEDPNDLNSQVALGKQPKA